MLWTERGPMLAASLLSGDVLCFGLTSCVGGDGKSKPKSKPVHSESPCRVRGLSASEAGEIGGPSCSLASEASYVVDSGMGRETC